MMTKYSIPIASKNNKKMYNFKSFMYTRAQQRNCNTYLVNKKVQRAGMIS